MVSQSKGLRRSAINRIERRSSIKCIINTTGQRSKEKNQTLSYALNDDNWPTYYSYLKSVISVEDISLAHRDMIILWCLRNSTKHFEASARDATGVFETIEFLISMGLKIYTATTIITVSVA